jgi:hypothetical protein
MKLSLARALERDHGRLDFRTILQPKGLVDEKGVRLYRALGQLSKVFVTTNFDEWLDTAITPPSVDAASAGAGPTTPVPPSITARKVVYRPEDLQPALLDEQDLVVHLHGHLNAPAGLIMTTPDYLRHYANDRSKEAALENRVLTFLQHLFQTRTVLFVGYGLAELELLEYVFQKGAIGSKQEARHYVLEGFCSHEEQLQTTLQNHYLNLGVELIRYSRDRRDWEELVYVLEEWGKEAGPTALLTIQKLKDMEALLE